MTFEEYDTKEEAYHAGYKNGKFIGAMEAAHKVIAKIKESREEAKEHEP